MKWFVHIEADYYPSCHVVEAKSAEEACQIAKGLNGGNTYEPGGDPACVVVPFDQCLFLGLPQRVLDILDG